MKKIILALVIVLPFVFLSALSPALAQTTTEDQQLQQSAQETDQEATQPNGQKNVTEKLKTRFNVSDERINQMRSQKMGYGEIKIALSLAEQMPGGINDENLQKVIALRRGDKKMGWGKVAKELNLKAGDVVKKVKNTGQNLKTSKQKAATAASAATGTPQATGQQKGPKDKVHKGVSSPTSPAAATEKPPKTNKGKK